MGAVYQAWDAELGVIVALKVIRPEVAADPAAAAMLERRFKQELLLARQVTHKNVVRIHELGEIDGIKFITMPFIEGEELGTILRRQDKLPIERIMKIARGIATGLEAAHAAGVVHRDLKPANIMVDKNDDAMIMDFGIARSTGGPAMLADVPAALRQNAWAGGQTMAGAVVGTVQYMAPEQARAQPVDQRADIYAFGLIVYDMLLNRQRARGADTALDELTRRMQAAPPPTRSVDATIPEAARRDRRAVHRTGRGSSLPVDAAARGGAGRLDDRGKLLPVARRVTRRLVAAVGLAFVMLIGADVVACAWTSGARWRTSPCRYSLPTSRTRPATRHSTIRSSRLQARAGRRRLHLARTTGAESGTRWAFRHQTNWTRRGRVNSRSTRASVSFSPVRSAEGETATNFRSRQARRLLETRLLLLTVELRAEIRSLMRSPNWRPRFEEHSATRRRMQATCLR